MQNSIILLLVLTIFFSCAEDTDITVPRNLQEYIEVNFDDDLGEVIAYAGNADNNENLTYIFYYPVTGASDIRYYEADSVNVNPNDFKNYRRKNVPVTPLFGGVLKRFSRQDSKEGWGLVTYVLQGKLHKSNPIRFKNKSVRTTWSNKVSISYPSPLEPKFIWSDFGKENEIYFQVVSDEDTENDEEKFLSGTYTLDTSFQYGNNSNVVLAINETETTVDLVEDKEYTFTMMGISQDNWINVIVEETFVPRNLQEYLTIHNNKTLETTFAFGAKDATNNNLVYLYYYPLVGATEFRYYETENVDVDPTDFSNYNRKKITNQAVFGGKLRRYSRTTTQEKWAITTYIIGNTLYKSEPVKIQHITKPTKPITGTTDALSINFSQPLQPVFTWTDGETEGNVSYFQVFTSNTDEFLSGVFTTLKTIQYGDFEGLETINTEKPPALILEDNYKFTVFGLDPHNWANLNIQQSFEAK